MNNTVDIGLDNYTCVSDEHEFDSITDALRWAYGRGGAYRIEFVIGTRDYIFHTHCRGRKKQSIEWKDCDWHTVWPKAGEDAWTQAVLELMRNGKLPYSDLSGYI